MVELDNCRILIYEEKITSAKSLLPLLQKISKNSLSLLIIAEDIEGGALAILAINKLCGILKIATVKAPGYGDRSKAMLEDTAVLTGGTLICEDLGIKLEGSTRCSRELEIAHHALCDTCRGTVAKPGTSPQTCDYCSGRKDCSDKRSSKCSIPERRSRVTVGDISRNKDSRLRLTTY